jgi:hypothetical protein
MAYLNVVKGWPNVYAVDLSLVVGTPAAATIVEGMCISNVSDAWQAGCAKGKVPFITGPEQSPTALDVARTKSTTFANGTYPSGIGEMGRQYMGGISLTNAIVFETDQYTALTSGQVAYSPATTASAGKFTQATNAAHQICGVCDRLYTDDNGNALVRIIAMPVLQIP